MFNILIRMSQLFLDQGCLISSLKEIVFPWDYLQLRHLTCNPVITNKHVQLHRTLFQIKKYFCSSFFKDLVTAVKTQMDAAPASPTIGEMLEKHLSLQMIRKRSKKMTVCHKCLNLIIIFNSSLFLFSLFYSVLQPLLPTKCKSDHLYEVRQYLCMKFCGKI